MMLPIQSKFHLELVHLALHASLPVKCTIGLLVASSLSVWMIAFLKLAQLGRLRRSEAKFEDGASRARSLDELMAVVTRLPKSPGARVVSAMSTRGSSNAERLRAVADRAIVAERKSSRSSLSALGSIATAAPFIGLFGTVYGIMDAFMRIGAAKSASLPVVAPAIGEALVTTAIGLAVAIPAVVFYNAIDKRAQDLVAELEASAAEWVVLFTEAAYRTRPSIPAAAPVAHYSSYPPPPAPMMYAAPRNFPSTPPPRPHNPDATLVSPMPRRGPPPLPAEFRATSNFGES